MRCLIYDPKLESVKQGGIEVLEEWLAHDERILWLDLDLRIDTQASALLSEKFNVDALIVSDTLRERHPPKLEVFDQHFFAVLAGLSAETKGLDFEFAKVSVFVGRNYFITAHWQPSLSTNALWEQLTTDAFSKNLTPAKLFYRLSRAVINRYSGVVMEQEERLEVLEDQLLDSGGEQVLSTLTQMTSRLRKLRRMLTFYTNVFTELIDLIRNDKAGDIFRREDLLGVKDVYEHIERLASMSELFQSLALDMINAYLSLSSHKLNQIMKTLTLVTVLFLPLSLLVGIYGMNFANMPELGWRYGYFALLGIMGLIVLAVVVYFKRKNWF